VAGKIVAEDGPIDEDSDPDDLEASLQGDIASTDDLVDEFRDFIESINPEDFQP
jgi:hypothetical protein